ncbi:hypothetical protein FPG87_12510 [Flavobacterium psychrophilum]|uniref:Uncharacterized protein n=1 Tax=Flavobacterium psychrophilum TaxID=96345 RepID=A0A7U2RAS1_FLAPS|nr:hypothetical protein [Flavobacterium psychrophilum]MBF2091281.1 hypothetical protein [Flavobacterium psychrophilum]OAE92160.1 hypothetical protein SU65_10420 [Flavobacterium psychrophilum]OJH10064.1 hypothetical protein FPG87_12510 [Flavobacterium psychrophilum]QRE05315.1 hypothetical protein H0H26_06935 [Flavobacterium psychrophilum]SNA67023.1 hypothetical protein DK150_170013 [Flavobacterium psychrophilum]
MTATKVKPTETIGDDLPILTFQVNRIMKNCQYQVDIKNEWVQWVTADVNRTSLKSITQAEAKKVIMAQEGSTFVNQPVENWGKFSKSHPLYSTHQYIFSLCITKEWSIPNDKHGVVIDTYKLSDFLKSKFSPVKKPLMDMTHDELEKLIVALGGVVQHHWTKK